MTDATGDDARLAPFTARPVASPKRTDDSRRDSALFGGVDAEPDQAFSVPACRSAAVFSQRACASS